MVYFFNLDNKYSLPKYWISSFKLSNNRFNFSQLDYFTSHKNSLLLKDKKFIYKFCKIQKFPKDYLRKLLLNSQAKREFLGAKFLNSISIKTPKAIAYGYTIFPFESFESFYIMEFINGAVTLDEVILGDKSKDLIDLIVLDLIKMRNNNIIFKDLRFHNILLKSGELIWIDTDIKVVKKNYNYELNKSVKRLTEKYPKLRNIFLKRLKLQF